MDYRADLLTPDQPDRYRETLNAFVAPVAHEADAVAKDPLVLLVAEAVYEAFGDHGISGGLTRVELASACSKNCVSRSVREQIRVVLVDGPAPQERRQAPSAALCD